MSFRFVSKSVTLNDLERRNGHFGVISATSVAFSAHCVKVVEDMPKRSVKKYSPKFLVLAIYYLWRYSQWMTPSEGVKLRNSPVVR